MKRRFPSNFIASPVTRRTFLKGMAAGVSGVALLTPGQVLAQEDPHSTLKFEEIAHGIDKDQHVAKGYTADVLLRWGDPVLADAPPFDPAHITAEAQAKQFGYNCDYVAFLPLPQGKQSSTHGLLCVNHEYPNPELMFADLPDAGPDADQVAAQLAGLGHSVVEIRKTGDTWKPVMGDYNRRITGTTTIRISGPAAGNARLKTKADPDGVSVSGTLGNCSGGTTPWGTVLSGEENIQFYFGGASDDMAQWPAYKRMGVSDYAKFNWMDHIDRFNVAKEPNEPNRFGWVVEIDPYDPQSVPVKRTALGRFRHEGATCVLNKDGRVVVYLGDDGQFEYIYRFVTSGKFDPKKRAANMDLLDDGTLYAAKFHDNGNLQWLPLEYGKLELTEKNGFTSQADVLIDARRAAEIMGATPMDRPEDIECDPVTGKVYAVLTNNIARSRLELNRPNPRAENYGGQIVEMIPPGKGKGADHTAEFYAWGFFIVAGNPKDKNTYYGRGITDNGWFACPDNIAFDGRGRIWIATDQGDWQSRFGIGDGLYAADTWGTARAVARFFYRVPVGAEMCGPCFTPDSLTLFLAVQHPGEGSTLAAPSTRWPDFNDGTPPRPSVVAVRNDSGDEIGQ